MVHLDIVDDDHFRQVMEELGALVEEGGVVLIALQYAECRIGEPAAATQVAGDAANHEAGVEPVGFQHPGQHGGGGCLAVGSGHDQVALAPEKEFLHGFRQTHVAQAGVEHCFHFNVAAAHGVADDHHVGVCRDVGGVVALENLNALILEESGHGRVDIGIGAGYHVALSCHGRCNGPHGGATYSEKVNVFHIVPYSA